jgi:hypothetical protein
MSNNCGKGSVVAQDKLNNCPVQAGNDEAAMVGETGFLS